MTTNNMQLFWLIYLFLISSTCFGRCIRPSSGARLYLQLLILSTGIAGVMDEMELQFRLIHDQPAAILVDNIRTCEYSQVLLMMGEDIARNM